jgi:hypothetical protein
MSKSKAARRAGKTRRPPRRGTGRAGAAAQNRNPQFAAIALTVDAGPGRLLITSLSSSERKPEHTTIRLSGAVARNTASASIGAIC